MKWQHGVAVRARTRWAPPSLLPRATRCLCLLETGTTLLAARAGCCPGKGGGRAWKVGDCSGILYTGIVPPHRCPLLSC